MAISIHDNNIYGYTVNCGGQQIVLYTEFSGQAGMEYTDVVFDGVVAHHFERVLKGNILFDIEEVEPEAIVKQWAELFALQKSYGWPGIDYTEPEQLIGILKQRGVKGFDIGSSYGMSGWVLAETMELSERPTRRWDK
jgi:hypothetical protein